MQRALALKLKALPGGSLQSSLTTRSLYSQHTDTASAKSLVCAFHRSTDEYTNIRAFTTSSHQQNNADVLQKDGKTPSPQKTNATIPSVLDSGRFNRQRPRLARDDRKPGQTPTTIRHAGRNPHRQAPPTTSSTYISAKDFLARHISALKLPTAEDVPNLPPYILKDPVSLMQSAVSCLAKVHERSSGTKGNYKHIITIEDPTVGMLQILESGPSVDLARKAAYLQLLAKLHEKDAVGSLIPPKGSQLEQEKNAMLDVYLFAARYEDIPEITTQTVSRVKHVQITLPLLEISVFARAKTELNARIAAALLMKQKMERLVQESDLSDKQVEDEMAFGFQTAEAFCQWYKINNRGILMDLSTQQQAMGSITAFNSIMKLHGTVTEEAREFGAGVARNKKDAETLAQFIAAVTLAKENPEERIRFFQEYKKNNNQVLAPLSPITFAMSEETSSSIQMAIQASEAATEHLEESEEASDESQRTRSNIYIPLSRLRHERKSDDLQSRQKLYNSRDDLRSLRKTRSEYPMNQHLGEVLETVNSNTYSIIIGATGSGKTTQVPQILLNDAIAKGDGASCNIICTQPRRIAAKSVAQRVADERAEFLGDCVGYHVKKDVKLPQYGGSINFCTTGILSQQLQFAADDIMENVSHIILDEVHERDTIIDFTLTTVKRLIRERIAEGKKVPRVILMSATIDADLFAGYLASEDAQGNTLQCPTLTVPGRTFPVKEFYFDEVLQQIQSSTTIANLKRDMDTAKFLDVETNFSKSNKALTSDKASTDETESTSINWDAERRKATQRSNISVEEQDQALVPYELAAATIKHIARTTPDGAILTFVPGLEDITKINDILRLPNDKDLDFSDESKFKIFMLHSSIATAQKDVFDPVPEGCRKIILATNIAETSITIPDVQHVVDTGKHRELQYDQTRRITKLACVWISKSNAKQRAGRAGRVQNGNYYALFSRERYESFRAVGLPELLRSDLQEVCLDVKNQGFTIPVREFLAETIEPPGADAVDGALKNLVSLQALNEDESMTPLGKLLAKLPVHPSLGKMIVLGIVFRCLDPMLLIGSSFSERSLFLRPLDHRKEAIQAKNNYSINTSSDHIGLLAAMKELRMIDRVRGQRALYDYSMRNFLHMGAYRSILGTAETIEELLAEHRVIPRTSRMQRAQFQLGDARLNENSDKVGLIKALILAGFSPNVGVRRGRVTYRTPQTASAIAHPGSINAMDLKRGSKMHVPVDPRTELLSFSELVRSNDGNTMYIRETTPVTPLMTVLFSGKLEPRSRNMITMDDWLPFYLRDAQQVKSVLTLYRKLQQVTSAAFADLASGRSLAEHEERNNFADLLVAVFDADLAAYTSQPAIHGTRQPQQGFSKSATGSPFSRSSSLTKERSTDPKKQDLWENLMASWTKQPATKSATPQDARPSSVADLFADSGYNSNTSRERGY